MQKNMEEIKTKKVKGIELPVRRLLLLFYKATLP